MRLVTRRGTRTLIIDVGDVLGISDNFIITSGMNSRQFALVEEIEAQITNKSARNLYVLRVTMITYGCLWIMETLSSMFLYR